MFNSVEYEYFEQAEVENFCLFWNLAQSKLWPPPKQPEKKYQQVANWLLQLDSFNLLCLHFWKSATREGEDILGESIVRIGLGAITAIRGSLLRGAPHLQGKESGNHKKSTQLGEGAK